MIDKLPTTGVTDSIKDLAAEVAQFLPRQEKNQAKSGSHGMDGGDHGVGLLRDEAYEDWVPFLDRFRTSLAGFLGQLNNFAECSVTMFGELQRAIEQAKNNYEQYKSQL